MKNLIIFDSSVSKDNIEVNTLINALDKYNDYVVELHKQSHIEGDIANIQNGYEILHTIALLRGRFRAFMA